MSESTSQRADNLPSRYHLRVLGMALLVFGCSIHGVERAAAQQTTITSSEEIRALVQDLKLDSRGPFQSIRWFCPDGSVIPAQSRCSSQGGQQHGLHKSTVQRLAVTNHVFLGQVLAGTDKKEFLDEENGFSRLKQYQIEQFLNRSDDGWIMRKARFYRGAFQAEDEESWGRDYLIWMLAQKPLIERRFFMVREAVRDLPHGEANNLILRIRATSKEISDAYPAFLDTRVKIHGQPEASDTLRVARFGKQHRAQMSPELVRKLDALYQDLRGQYTASPFKRLGDLANRLPATSESRKLLNDLVAARPTARRLSDLAMASVTLRREIERTDSGKSRLLLMDLSLEVENLAFQMASGGRPATIGQLVKKFSTLANLAAGTGLLEWWEWSQLKIDTDSDSYTFDEFETLVARVQRVVGWGIGMVTATFEKEVERFATFEPLAQGFLDDRMRSTVLLAMGEAAGSLADELSVRSGRVNRIMAIPSQGGARGLNPGIALGELVVHTGSPEEIDFKPNAIYVLSRAPADLKPVAGIATVSEGNLVSHVQLLARNLGIPNAVVSPEVVEQLRASNGQQVFYAVSPGGTIVMKRADQISEQEKKLIEKRSRAEQRIRVPIDRVDLKSRKLESLHNLRAGDSGRVCGPKAANLGQLSALFPKQVAPGFIVPFGVFRAHMDQQIPGTSETYWSRLRRIFAGAEKARSEGVTETIIEKSVLAQLADLRVEIERMPLDPSFVTGLRQAFLEIMEAPIGKVPVFVRSDTNMEDLKDFTGAGLNLTVPNVVTEEDIKQSIRRVWASPYRDRGYQWRQRYLLNPEDVYPSLLILKSVNVDKSGVMITSSVATGDANGYTIAFSRGVGGAVDGQAAEMYDLSLSTVELLSPARESEATTLPKSGGVKKVPVSFDERVLSEDNLEDLRRIGGKIRRVLPGTPGIETNGPFDIELGFLENDIWLFQTRPFVENRSAGQSTYLSRMDIRTGKAGHVQMTDQLTVPRP